MVFRLICPRRNIPLLHTIQHCTSGRNDKESTGKPEGTGIPAQSTSVSSPKNVFSPRHGSPDRISIPCRHPETLFLYDAHNAILVY